MTDQELQQFIQTTFARLPRREIELGQKKEQVWLKIEQHLREKRAVAEPASIPLTGFRFAKITLSALIVIVIAGLTLALTSAAQGALPGETLYPIKRHVVERVEIALATTPEKKVRVLKDHAQTRLQEVSTLVKQPITNEVAVAETLRALTTTTEKVDRLVEQALTRNPALLEEAFTLASEGEELLNSIEEQVKGKADGRVQEAIVASRNSLNKLKADPGAVEGELAEETATSTPTTTVPVQPRPKKVQEDGVIESDIHIDNVFRSGGSEEPAADEPIKPEILPQPRGF